MSIYPFLISFIAGFFLIPAVRRLSIRFGWISEPKRDRWHKRPTPSTGGIGIFLAFLIGVAFFGDCYDLPWGLFIGSTIMFGIGLFDDHYPLTPPVKLMVQFVAASVVVFAGYTTSFFDNELLNILLTFVWLIGITNAINLLDNMDGLAGGISVVAAGFLSYFFFRTGSPLLPMSLALTGALLGFLIFNFPPASIFMGDSGSLFIGFTLAALAIARSPQASNVFAVMGVPTFLFLLPIIDTSLVMVTRMLRGQSPMQGGRDHTSHRLVAFGLTERQAVLILYVVALVSGVVGAVIETIDYALGLVLLPVIVIAFALLAAYLGRIKVVDSQRAKERVITNIVLDLAYKRRVFELMLDFFLISVSFYAAFWIRYDFSLSEVFFSEYLRSLPWALGCAYFAFWIFGVYRGVWQYFGLEDLTRFARAVTGMFVLICLAAWAMTKFNLLSFSLLIFVLFAIFVFVGLAATRSSFKILDQLFSFPGKLHSQEEKVLIYDAGDEGEIALRWILRNPELGYRVVGFVDDDAYKKGRTIHGIGVVGGLENIEELAKTQQLNGFIITSAAVKENESSEKILKACKESGLWVRKLTLEFELLN